MAEETFDDQDVPPLARQLDILRALPDTIEAAIRTGRAGVPASLSAELDAALAPVRTDVRRLREDVAAAVEARPEATPAGAGETAGRVEDLLERLTMVLDAHMDNHRRIDAIEEKLDRVAASLAALLARPDA